MSNSGGFAVTRSHPESRFYHPPAVRRHQLLQQQQQQLLLQQQQLQLQRQKQPVRKEAPPLGPAESDESALSVSRPNSVCSSSAADLTHLDRLIESVTPSVRAHHLPEVRVRGRRARNSEIRQYFSLGDLWEAFREWSVYGVGVPLVLNGTEPMKQYYVPSLSGIQLFIDTHRMRKPGEESDAESSRETSSHGSSDCESDRKGKGNVEGTKTQQNSMTLSFQKMNRLTLNDNKPPMSSPGDDEAEVNDSSGKLVFEYYELEQPHHRKPLYDKVSSLAIQFPDLKSYRSCDLLPTSWISVAWYPIYRIPVGPTLQNLDASFLTFHHLSTHSRSKIEPQLHVTRDRKFYGLGQSTRFSLPVFGLASYKLRGSILTPNSAHELEQANSLLQAADAWLRQLQVNLPDYKFFVSHNSHWR